MIARVALEKARRRAIGRAAAPRPAPPRLVALYAAQPFEPTFEMLLPPDGEVRQSHGLLTYTLCQVLHEPAARLTYRELAQRIRAQYTRWGRTSPTPLIDGADVDREVLGLKSWPGRSEFVLRRDSVKDWMVNGGRLRGLSEGSILAVYPPNKDKLIGHVHILHSDALESEVEPHAHAGMAAPKELPEGGRCEMVQLAYDLARVPVAVDKSEKAQAASLNVLDKQLREWEKEPGAVFRMVGVLGEARWVVQVRDGRLFLLPAEAAQTVRGQPASSGPRFPLGDEPAAALKEALGRIARAENLLALTKPTVRAARRGAVGTINVDVEMLKLRDENDEEGTPLKGGTPGATVSDGDWVAWRVVNQGREAVDVTLLLVNSGFGIEVVFPRPGTSVENRLLANQELRTPARRLKAANAPAQEHLVAIAVRGEGQPVDFTCLAQPTLEQARDAAARGASGRTFDSPLGRLFQQALYCRGEVRSRLDMEVIDKYSLHLLSWRVLPLPAGG